MESFRGICAVDHIGHGMREERAGGGTPGLHQFLSDCGRKRNLYVEGGQRSVRRRREILYLRK